MVLQKHVRFSIEKITYTLLIYGATKTCKIIDRENYTHNSQYIVLQKHVRLSIEKITHTIVNILCYKNMQDSRSRKLHT